MHASRVGGHEPVQHYGPFSYLRFHICEHVSRMTAQTVAGFSLGRLGVAVQRALAEAPQTEPCKSAAAVAAASGATLFAEAIDSLLVCGPSPNVCAGLGATPSRGCSRPHARQPALWRPPPMAPTNIHTQSSIAVANLLAFQKISNAIPHVCWSRFGCFP